MGMRCRDDDSAGFWRAGASSSFLSALVVIDWEEAVCYLEPVILASIWWWGRRGIGVLLVP